MLHGLNDLNDLILSRFQFVLTSNLTLYLDYFYIFQWLSHMGHCKILFYFITPLTSLNKVDRAKDLEIWVPKDLKKGILNVEP